MNKKEQAKDRRLRAKYNVTLAEFNAIVHEQGGVCAGCKRPASDFKNGLALDHDHNAEKRLVRGALCYNCNGLLPCRRNLYNVLRNLLIYLAFPPAVKVLGERLANPLKRRKKK